MKLRVKSRCSTNPAALVVVSKLHGLDELVTENVVPLVVMSDDGVIFVPDHVFTAAPKTWTCSVSTIV